MIMTKLCSKHGYSQFGCPETTRTWCQQDCDSMHVNENMQITLWEVDEAYLAYHREKIFKG